MEEGPSTRATKGGAAPTEEQRAMPEKGPCTGATEGGGATEERVRAWRETTTTVFLGPVPEQQESGLGLGFCWPNKFGVIVGALLELDFLPKHSYLAIGA